MIPKAIDTLIEAENTDIFFRNLPFEWSYVNHRSPNFRRTFYDNKRK